MIATPLRFWRNKAFEEAEAQEDMSQAKYQALERRRDNFKREGYKGIRDSLLAVACGEFCEYYFNGQGEYRVVFDLIAGGELFHSAEAFVLLADNPTRRGNIIRRKMEESQLQPAKVQS